MHACGINFCDVPLVAHHSFSDVAKCHVTEFFMGRHTCARDNAARPHPFLENLTLSVLSLTLSLSLRPPATHPHC
jgi:hypothetical protein